MPTAETAGRTEARRLSAVLVRHWRMAIVLMVCAYLVVGTFWRAPWKADEPYSFGIVLNIIERGDWVVPNVAFEPFVEKPPLMYWSGALAALAVPELPPHRAVRLAVLFWMALACLSVWRAARLLRGEARDWRMRVGAQLAWPGADPGRARRLAGLDAGGTALRDYALGALLLFVGCIGLVEHVHKFIADVPQLAGTAMALYGLVYYAKAGRPGRRGCDTARAVVRHRPGRRLPGQGRAGAGPVGGDGAGGDGGTARFPQPAGVAFLSGVAGGSAAVAGDLAGHLLARVAGSVY